MTRLLNPWLMILVLGFCVFLIGKYFQIRERKKRLERKQAEMILKAMHSSASASPMLRGTSQATPSAPGLRGIEGQGSQEQIKSRLN
jgi:hypothetical protein